MISRIMGDSTVFRILADFMKLCGPLIIPALITSPTAAEYYAEYGLEICAPVFNSLPTRGSRIDYAVECRFIGGAVDLVRITKRLLQLPPHLNRDFQQGHARKAFVFLTRVVSILGLKEISQELKPLVAIPACHGFAKYAAALYVTCTEEINIPINHVFPYIRAHIDYLNKPPSPGDLAISMLLFAKGQQFCFAAGCMESAQSSGRLYMRCGGCGIVAYSSKECQRRAWTDKRLPHRAICKKIKLVVDAAGDRFGATGTNDGATLLQNMERANISDSLLTEVGNWLESITEVLQRKDPQGSEPPPYPVGALAGLNYRDIVGIVYE
jgi:hypothetical protein